MQRSLERFQISPEEYFAEVDRTFADLREMLNAQARRADELSELCREMARSQATTARTLPAPTRWTYDARQPNYYFDDLFQPEPVEGGGACRWVGAGGNVAVTLQLPRNVQYEVAIQVQDFCAEAAAKSFYIRIDGLQFPWFSHDGKRYASLTMTDDKADTLALAIGVDPATVPPGHDRAFSFRTLDVTRWS